MRIKLNFFLMCLLIILNNQNLFSFDTSAENALLIDFDTNQILYSKNEEKKIYPASMSKLMTLYILFDSLKKGIVTLDDKFVVSRNAYQKEGSTIYAELGTEISVQNLIRGIIVSSGNDACIIVAEALSGSEDNFANQMNFYAEEMGLRNSNFKNSSGLHNEDHYTSAEDLVKLSSLLITDFPEYYPYFAERSFTWNSIIQYNRNNILRMDLGVDGLKTGYTSKSGYGVIVSSEKNGRRLIGIVTGLKSVDDRTNEISRLINYGYRGFKSYSVFKDNQIIDYAKVWKGNKNNLPLIVDKDINLLLDIPGRRGINVEYKYNEPIYAPIFKGDVVGSIDIIIPGRKNIKLDLLAGEDVKQVNFFTGFIRSLDYFLYEDE
ncbi:MAG: D-alanyl-D-alanine carboxypeptidase family protein [Pseudomonadota bacterium]|nr:D-alanyl-D-alanine carboxypeptidase family protein [Pseudomonadota bacterium]